MSDLLAHGRRIQAATLFLPGFGDPEEHPDFNALIERVRTLVDPGAEVTFVPGQAAYPGFDPFRAVTVRANGAYVASLADRWHDDEDRAFALGILRAAFRPAAAEARRVAA